MVYGYDTGKSTLYFDSVELPPLSQEKNIIGTCTNCNSDVQSVSYHNHEKNNIVAARCVKCNLFNAIVYDTLWNWLGEESVSSDIISKIGSSGNKIIEPRIEATMDTEELHYLRSIPANKLSAVFSPAEIEAMFLKASEQKYVRQYLYRARKKYQDFNDLFDIMLNI